MNAARSSIRNVKAAADGGIAVLWIVVVMSYLVGLHHEAHALADAAAGWTLVWFLVRHPRLILEFAFVGVAASAIVTSRRSGGSRARVRRGTAR